MKIALITGGTGSERSVSLQSCDNVRKSITFADVEIFLYPEEFANFSTRKSEFDAVIPVIHGVCGEDGEVQRECETLGVPYLFSEPEPHKHAYDKELCKNLLLKEGIRSPRTYHRGDSLVFPLIRKPRTEGSSVGVSVIRDESDVPTDDRFLLEEFVRGREYSVGVVEMNGKSLALPVVEIRKDTELFDYETKYSARADSMEICPARIPGDLSSQLRSLAKKVHDTLGLRHVSRSDFIVNDQGVIFFLEVNTIPGMTERSILIKELQVANLSLPELLSGWIRSVI